MMHLQKISSLRDSKRFHHAPEPQFEEQMVDVAMAQESVVTSYMCQQRGVCQMGKDRCGQDEWVRGFVILCLHECKGLRKAGPMLYPPLFMVCERARGRKSCGLCDFRSWSEEA